MQNSRFQCLSKRMKSKRDACLTSSDVQEVDMYVLEAKGFTALWVAAQKKQGLNKQQIDAKAAALGIAGFAASNGSAIHDIRSFYLLAEDLKRGGSILSKYEVAQQGNKIYIKFKGNHRLRSLIKGTRYLSNNAEIIALGIGKEGMKASARAGVLVTVIYSVTFRILELALTTNYSVADWVSNVSSDLVKAAISAVFGLIVGGLVASSSVVLAPLFVGGVAAFMMGKLLDYIDGRFLIKEKIIEVLNVYIDQQVKSDVNNQIGRGVSQKSVHALRANSYGFVFL